MADAPVLVLEYNGTTGEADAGYSSEVADLNLFYQVCQYCIASLEQ